MEATVLQFPVKTPQDAPDPFAVMVAEKTGVPLPVVLHWLALPDEAATVLQPRTPAETQMALVIAGRP